MSYPFRPQDEDLASWATATFGKARLGDARRTARLVRLATGASQRPAGCITEVFLTSAERQGAYGLLEDEQITPAAVGGAAFMATLETIRQRQLTRVDVALDGSSLTLTDRRHTKQTGPVGNRRSKNRGFEVMTALAVSDAGEPLGLVDQHYWARPTQRPRKSHKARKTAEKETQHWLDAMDALDTRFQALNRDAARPCRPRGLLDRGGDCRPVLLKADQLRARCDFIVRAAWNRRLNDPEVHYLWEQVERSALLCESALQVPAGPKRTARTATMQVRARKVSLRLRDKWNKTTTSAEFWAVHTREVGTTPVGETPVEWMLLTTCEVRTAEEACEIVRAYGHRWRVEELHRAWKRGMCHVEDTQLRSGAAIQKWAIVLAVVAARAVQLAYRARTEPNAPSTVALTQEQIDATIVLRRPAGWGLGTQPPLHQVVGWIAELGGYTGKSSGGPPGPTVLARGLREVDTTVRALQNLKDLQGKEEM